jgi:hypothetical protein
MSKTMQLRFAIAFGLCSVAQAQHAKPSTDPPQAFGALSQGGDTE